MEHSITDMSHSRKICLWFAWFEWVSPGSKSYADFTLSSSSFMRHARTSLHLLSSPRRSSDCWKPPNICEIIWFDTIHCCTVLSEILKPTIPPTHFGLCWWFVQLPGRMVPCWNFLIFFALRSYQLYTLYRCLGVSFPDFIVCINCKLNNGCSFACHIRASKAVLN